MSKFKKGESGNPGGRPAGSTAATIIRKDIEQELPGILAKVIQQAVDGDMQACKILLDKICPNLRPQALPVSIELGGTLPETGGNVLAATMSGAIPPDIGSMLITALSNQGKLVEFQELAERLQRIEKQLEIQNALK